MVSVWLLAKAREYLLRSFTYQNTHIQVRLDVQNIDRMGKAWLFESDSLAHEFSSSLEEDTILYSCGPREHSATRYTIRIIQPHKHNYGQKTADAFAVLIDEEGHCRSMNTLYFWDIQNPDNSTVSYLGQTLDNCVYLH